jgi:hypothetical protein
MKLTIHPTIRMIPCNSTHLERCLNLGPPVRDRCRPTAANDILPFSCNALALADRRVGYTEAAWDAQRQGL